MSGQRTRCRETVLISNLDPIVTNLNSRLGIPFAVSIGLLLGASRCELIAGTPDSPRFRDRWVYCATNLLVDENVDRTIDLVRRAGRGGFTGLMLADYKLQILERVDERYFRNAARVKQAASSARIELIPAVFPIGYSNGILAHDPNLAEGILASSIPHEVGKDDVVTLVPHPEARIKNGDFEQARSDRFADFSFQDDPGGATAADTVVVHGGRQSCRIEPNRHRDKGEVARVIQPVSVRPHACYRLSCWVKTEGVASTGSFRLLALAGDNSGRALTFQEGGIESTQDWKRLEVTFNTLDKSTVNLYAGHWGKGAGKIWIDDLRLEELSLVNVLRRKGCPLVVKSSDGRTTYREGRDFEPVADARLGQVPWAGEFEFDHQGPALRLARGSTIRPGTKLLVSWYHPILTHGSQIMCCLSEPKVETILRDQARRVHALFRPRTFFMSHDEIRFANWCELCQSRKKTPGQLLAEHARRCEAIIKSINPAARVVVWSDMFDPNHNAVEGYYLVNGTLAGSWDGLSRTTIIANWNSGKARQSLEFFNGRGHRQVIAGYYDADSTSELDHWKAACRGIDGIDGFMYTTWQSRYDLLEAYGKSLK